jgi:membrane protein implicated in regulation of membrane protease activity
VRRLRWDQPEPARKVTKHPYRDSALVYGALAILVVVIAFATGGGVLRAVVFAGIVFLVATAWSWRSLRNREREDRRNAEHGER